MPNGDTGNFQQFYNAFRKWATQKYGWWKVFSEEQFSHSSFRESPYYRQWMRDNAPGWGKGKVEPSPTWPPWQPSKWGEPNPAITAIGEMGLKPYAPIQPTEPTEPTAPTWMEDYERRRAEAELKLLQAQLAQAGKPTSAEMQMETERQRALSLQRQQLLGGGARYYRTGEQPQEAMSQRAIFEQARNAILSTLTSPADWIDRYLARTMENPYEVEEEEETEFGEIANAAERTSKEASYWDRKAAQANAAGDNEVADIALKNAKSARQRARNFRQEATAMREEGGDLSIYKRLGPRGEGPSATPPAPAWLSKFAPGQVAGQPITKEQIPTPSGQLLSKTPWSTMEGMRGYAQWTGGRPWQDIMEHAEMMQPRTPAGAGRFRYRPFRS